MLAGFLADAEALERRRSSPSTRRTASASGATISGPSTASSAQLRELLPDVPLSWRSPPPPPTACAQDIVKHLRCASRDVFVASFNRPNLIYRVAAKDEPDEAAPRLRANSAADEAASSTASARRRRERVAEALAPTASAARPTTPAWTPTSARATRSSSCATRCASSAPPSPSAWASTSPTSASSSTTTCPRTSRATTRRPAAPGATACPRDCLLLFSAGDVAKQTHFIDEITDAHEREHRPSRSCGRWCTTPRTRLPPRAMLLAYFGES